MKKKNILITLAALILLISVIAVTYAYYVVGVSNANKQTASITTGTMSLTFSDNDNGFGGQIKFGDTITKKFTIQNTGTLDASAQMNWFNISNSYLEGSLKYTLEYSDSLNGTYTKIIDNQNVPRSDIKQTLVLAPNIKVPATKTYYYTLKVTLINSDTMDQTEDFDASFWTQFSLSPIKNQTTAESTLAALNLTSKTGSPDFSVVATTDETADGLYSTEDDYGTSYYFRGASSNNYVKFANFFWRIIRINGDGSLRIIYDGTSVHNNGEGSEDRVVGTSAFNDIGFEDLGNDTYNGYAIDNGAVGYMYGDFEMPKNCNTDSVCESGGSTSYNEAHANANDSTIKTYLDNWYKTNIVDKGFSNAVSDEIFCNDRSIDVSTNETLLPLLGVTNVDSNKLGYGQNITFYSIAKRLGGLDGTDPYTPELKCLQKNDKFTVSDTIKGNGALKYPVGLITADEVAIAGGKVYADDGSASNSNYYLYKGTDYWALSPSVFHESVGMMLVYSSGGMNGHGVYYECAVTPVINLSPEYARTLKGTGTMTDPYTAS